ncbi:MAG: non-canonical purine NTP pyrophosphatase, partial [Venatoribacter sp.]
MKIVLASGNNGKLNEFKQLFTTHFAGQNIELIKQSDLNVVEAEETGLSFVENAILKARNA